MSAFETKSVDGRFSTALCRALAAVAAGVLVPMSSHAQSAGPAGGATDAKPHAAEPAPAATAKTEVASEESAAEVETITVSARKREESVADVPSSITVFTAQTLEDYNIQSFNDYATKTPNISFSYGSGPTGIADARSVAIRGITGQNLYGTAGATGFYIDDTPIPGSVDPRVLDIANIEVLKGPQGTLFGESSLGGNVRLITKKPDLKHNGIGYMAEVGATDGAGSADGGGNVIGNIVLSPDKLALRIVAFANHDAGYLTRTYPSPTSPATTNPFLTVPRAGVDNQGAQSTTGGSIAALLKVTDNFEARLRWMLQITTDNGFPAAFAPLPDFAPNYTLDRAFNVQPQASDVWNLPSLDLNYRGEGWSLVSSTSYFYRHTRDLEDSTYGTQQILSGFYQVSGLPPQPYLWDGEHYHGQVAEEIRFSWDPWHNLSGTVGAFYAHTMTRFYIPPTYAHGLVAATANNTVVGPWPNEEIWTQNNPATQDDTSLFGEFYYKFLERFTATVGLRQYWLKQTADFTADGFLNFGATPSSPASNNESGVDPKFALAYRATDEAMVYASASKGFRAGGAQSLGTFCPLPPGLSATDITHLKSDTLWTYELGTKVQVPHPSLLISAAAFHIDWSDLQQQVALPCGYYFTINGNKATINGGELEVAGKLSRALQVRLGVGYEHTKITDPGALAFAGVPSDSRIFGTPRLTFSLGGVYTRAITSTLDGFASADFSYTGNSVSLLNSGFGAEATRPSYSLLNMRFGVDFGSSEVSLNFRNLTNARPNLGDIGYVGYAQFNAAGNLIPQVATLQPLTVLLQYRKNI
ncbi:MAG TPA: TonB-dependent receptor [Burkholderiaceae bacterium]|jgi:outer membrane receptor protein involved in Fe transport|nr:TonB-dependent receptor [Burkholderiaceae bacterium]